MNFPVRQRGFFIVSFVVAAFVLNFFWEWIQCQPFFRHLKSQPTAISMLAATVGDVAQLAIVLMLVSLFAGRWTWFLEDLNFGNAARIVFSSSLLASSVEWLALRTNRWSYTEINPVVPVLGVSVIPILQAVLLNLISLWISKKITFALCKREINTMEAT